jgi:hypothetical protein
MARSEMTAAARLALMPIARDITREQLSNQPEEKENIAFKYSVGTTLKVEAILDFPWFRAL